MDDTTILSTTQIPQEHWKAARLVGSIPFTACQYDQRASYCMYIPESHYQIPEPVSASLSPSKPPSHSNTTIVTTTTKLKSRLLPLIVNIHGSHRNAPRARDILIPLASQTGAAILAPLFPAGIPSPSPTDTHNYKFLSYKGIRYDLILLSMLDEVKLRWPGIDTSRIFLAGYSGGGQFASRFFMLHPGRVAGVSVGAPGTVTRLDWGVEWPWGLGGVEEWFGGVSVDVGALKGVKHVQLVVGDKDVEGQEDGFLKWRAEQMGKTVGVGGRKVVMPKSLPKRTEALAGLRDGLRGWGVEVQFDVVPGAGHDYLKVLPTVIEFLRDSISSTHPLLT